MTFAQDSNRFYATLASGGKTYLVEGNVLTRKANILWENVECPSLSPDDTRIAFKKLAPSRDHWQINILDLATMVETPLTDTLRVDDQVEWLDNSRILYAITDAEGANGKRIDGWSIMVQQADGSGEPQVFVPHAYSPAVVR